MTEFIGLFEYYFNTFGYFGIYLLIEFTPVSSDVELMMLGTLYKTIDFNIPIIVFGLAIFSTFLASVYYFLARLFDLEMLASKYKVMKKISFSKPENIQKMRSWIDQKGNIVIFLSRFIPGMRVASPIVCGMLKTSYLSFAVWTFFGVLLWSTSCIYIGKFLLASGVLANLRSLFQNIQLVSILVIIGLICLYIYFRRKKKKRS